MKRLSILSLTLLVSLNSAAADTTFGACILCHGSGVNGNVAIRAPKLAGMEEWYVLRQLNAFRSGVRGTHSQDVNGGEMRTIARSLRVSDLTKLANQIAQMTPEPTQRSIGGDASRGERLYVACAACHGARGEGNEALGAPSLAHGSDWYYAAQLLNYRNGLRGTVPKDTYGATMRAAALALPDEQGVRDVIAYINSLRR
jgi:cytochrome c553